MAIAKTVSYNPRRWSASIEKTMPADDHLQALVAQIWTFEAEVSIGVDDLNTAILSWMKTDQRLSMSLTPEGRVVCLHRDAQPSVSEAEPATPMFPERNPFLWHLSYKKSGDRIVRIWLFVKGVLGPDAKLISRLLHALNQRPELTWPAFPEAAKARATRPESMIRDIRPTSAITQTPLGDESAWRKVLQSYSTMPPLLLAGGVLLHTLRIVNSSLADGILFEIYAKDQLGPRYQFLSSMAEEGARFEDVLATLELTEMQPPHHKQWAVVTLGLESGIIQHPSSDDFVIRWALDSQGLSTTFTLRAGEDGQRLRRLLDLTIAALPSGKPADFTSEALAFFHSQNQTARAYDLDRTLIQLLQQSFTDNESRVALVCSHGSFTFGQIDRASDALAEHLADLGYGTGDLIGLGLPRDESMLICIFAVLKCGAGYVPLDPSFPPDRIRYMATDAKLRACLCDELVYGLTQDLTQCLNLKTIRAIYNRPLTSVFKPRIASPQSIAYVIYTSGSTGMPKGVMLSHRSVVNFILSMAESPGMVAEDRIIGVTTLSFDIAVLEIMLPLYTGACLVLASADEAKDGIKLSALLTTHGITHFQATASTYRLVLDAGFKGHLKKALCGGEAFPLDIARRLKPLCDEIWNMYGPTETTVWSSIYRLGDDVAMIPIGRPIANTTVAILDDQLRPLLPGNKGEIYIGGAGLALGYLGRADLTKERFVEAPLLGQMVYKTGDIGAFRSDGIIDISGRSDGQIKLRGYRMELGEIEAAMSLDPKVAVAIALVKEFTPDDKRLIAYLQIKPGEQWSDREFRQALRGRLPIYMVPQHFVVLDRLPLLPNGKIDRKALPHPQSSATEEGLKSTKLSLTTSQSRMLFVEALDPSSHVHNLVGSWILSRAMNEVAFKQALFAVIREQEALRTNIRVQAGLPEILLNDAALPAIPTVRLASRAAARAYIENYSKTPINLSQGQNFRLGFIDLPDGERIVFLLTHHIFWDGYSFGVFWRSLQNHYEESLRLGLPKVQEMEHRYTRYTQEASRTKRHAPELLRYWKDRFTPLPEVLELSYDFPRPQDLTHGANTVRLAWDTGLDADLLNFSRSNRVTPFHVLLSVYYVLLHRLSRQDDIVIGTPVLGRDSDEVLSLLGNFINAVPLRYTFQIDLPFASLITEVKALTQEAMYHSQYSIESLIADLSIPRDPSRTPLYNCMFFYQDHSNNRLMLGDQPLERFETDSQTVDTDLVLWVERSSSGCNAGFNFRKDLWQSATMEALASSFTRLLKEFLNNPLLPIKAPALATFPPLQKFSIAPPRHLDLWAWLSETIANQGDRIAVRTLDGKTMTYQEVHARASRIAGYLANKGVTRGDVVGVSLSRSHDLIPSLWAILALGATYLPLDPLYPSERLQFMASDAKAKVILTEMEYAIAFRSLFILTICLDRESKEILASTPVPLSGSSEDGEGLAYLIYTSGSTGQPKGVEISHAAVCHFLTAITSALNLDNKIKTLGITTISFDISVLEIFATLVNGGELVLVDHDSIMDGKILIHSISAFAINLLQATPATWRLLLESGWQGPTAIVGLCGGEALPKDLARSLITRLDSLWNVYGPTEATVWATAERVTDPETITIGNPLPYYEAYILDPNRQALPQGAIGDLYLGGPALARGYRFRPDLTQERFYPHPSATDQRIYDTGDLARFRADGKIEYMSRRDNQVKLRGFRIELGEIESSMMLHPDLKQAVCVVYQAAVGDSRLIAYAALQLGSTMTIQQLQQHLRGFLPNYMLPNILTVLDNFPLTPSGKIDKKALPKPHESSHRPQDQAALVMTPFETKVAELFKEILQIDSIRSEDNFFDAGGHSLLALRAIHRIETELGLTFKVRDLLLLSVSQIAFRLEQRGDLL